MPSSQRLRTEEEEGEGRGFRTPARLDAAEGEEEHVHFDGGSYCHLLVQRSSSVSTSAEGQKAELEWVCLGAGLTGVRSVS